MRFLGLLVAAWLAAAGRLRAADELTIQPAGDTARAALAGPESRIQLVASRLISGSPRDVTHYVAYEVSPPGIVSIDRSALVTPLADGTAVVTVRTSDELSASTTLTVTGFAKEVPINFPNQIVPIFTKYGCNGGGCHGKASGQNGFRLSLLGFTPLEDHEYLVKEDRGRRTSASAPESSLLLAKVTGAVPHGGGRRIAPESHEYRLLRRWMEQGMPYGNEHDLEVVGLEVFPPERVMDRRGQQQLAVYARYSDGSVEDVTRMARYEANDPEMAEVSESGLVKTLELAGDVAVMIRYQAQVGVFRATLPLGVEVKDLPPARNFIDELVFKKLTALGIPPSVLCDDATFIRRATLDICGRLPTAEEARRFTGSSEAQKRDRLIDRLIGSPEYADFFASKWSVILRNKRANGSYLRGTYAFHDWIRDSLRRNRPYDQFVRDIVAAAGDITQNPPVAWYRSVPGTEQEVEDAAQLFLGLRLQCARCHHHPFERWSQRDYYSLSAFFSRLGRKPGVEGLESEQRLFHNPGPARSTNPRTGESLKPAGLGGPALEIAPGDDPRLRLADWLADPKNPFFARALVNRYWKHFFNRGLVEPEDDMRATNPASNPELLEALARRFIDGDGKGAGRFDLKDLVRTICRSTVYQLSSEPNPYNARDRQNFSRYYPKRLSAEVLYDAVNLATGSFTAFAGLPAGTRAVQIPDSGVENYFLTVFGRPLQDSACECERTREANLSQSLHLLNSSEVQDKLASPRGRVAALAADSKMAEADKVRELYAWAYAREPSAEDLSASVAHLKKSKNPQQAYEDILWALLNTKEFSFNH
jgi:uncharacterized protein DUF1549/uncharacterized protein DUF1553